MKRGLHPTATTTRLIPSAPNTGFGSSPATYTGIKETDKKQIIEFIKKHLVKIKLKFVKCVLMAYFYFYSWQYGNTFSIDDHIIFD